MKKYSDFPDFNSIPWTRYKIIVPTEEDRNELMEAFKHFHYSDIDTENITVNQLAHEYLDSKITGNPETKNNIVVDPETFNKISI